MSYHGKMIKGGKVVVPAELRRELGFKDGDHLVFERERDGCGVVIKSFAQILREVRAELKAKIKVPFTVDDFLAEKYAEAERE